MSGRRLYFLYNRPAAMDNHYIVGAGVGAKTRFARSALRRRANNNAKGKPCCSSKANKTTTTVSGPLDNISSTSPGEEVQEIDQSGHIGMVHLQETPVPIIDDNIVGSDGNTSGCVNGQYIVDGNGDNTIYCCNNDFWDGTGCTTNSKDNICKDLSANNHTNPECLNSRGYEDCTTEPRTCIGSDCSGEQFDTDEQTTLEPRFAKIFYGQNSMPTLQKDISGCDGIIISPEDMDKLAENIAIGGNVGEESIKILNTVGQRYIAKVVKGSECTCQYSGQKRYDSARWVDCNGSCVAKKSTVFGGGEITSTKGCGWWGRGVIQTTGPCNFGTLQAALMQDDENGNPSKYKNKFNLCKTPELICNTTKYKELKWLAGFFYWINDVENSKQWNFQENLNGDFIAFVDKTSGLVNRGCPSATACVAGAVDGAVERRKYAKNVFNMKDSTITSTTCVDIMRSVGKAKFTEVALATNGSKQTYDYEGFMSALEFVINTGIAGKRFTDNYKNLSAFLGQCMKETLQYGACDENNWTQSDALRAAVKICSNRNQDECIGICKWDGAKCLQNIYGTNSGTPPANFSIYPASASCGQLGQYYKHYDCSGMENACDPNELNDRTIIGTTHASWYGAPGVLYADGNDDGSVQRKWVLSSTIDVCSDGIGGGGDGGDGCPACSEGYSRTSNGCNASQVDPNNSQWCAGKICCNNNSSDGCPPCPQGYSRNSDWCPEAQGGWCGIGFCCPDPNGGGGGGGGDSTTPTCTCQNGTPATGTSCPSGGNVCQSCNYGYTLSGNQCVANNNGGGGGTGVCSNFSNVAYTDYCVCNPDDSSLYYGRCANGTFQEGNAGTGTCTTTICNAEGKLPSQ